MCAEISAAVVPPYGTGNGSLALAIKGASVVTQLFKSSPSRELWSKTLLREAGGYANASMLLTASMLLACCSMLEMQ